MTYKNIKDNEEVLEYLKKGNDNLGTLGYTDHSIKHCAIVAQRAGRILQTLEYKESEIQLAKIAGFMHDIGNSVNRSRHAEYGAILANQILEKTDMSSFDIHDRVNYAVTEQNLKINKEKKTISLNLQIDENICTMYEYFEIFLGRMMMCRRAAEMLGTRFKLTANGSKIL